jgi:hypothetical protein
MSRDSKAMGDAVVSARRQQRHAVRMGEEDLLGRDWWPWDKARHESRLSSAFTVEKSMRDLKSQIKKWYPGSAAEQSLANIVRIG